MKQRIINNIFFEKDESIYLGSILDLLLNRYVPSINTDGKHEKPTPKLEIYEKINYNKNASVNDKNEYYQGGIVLPKASKSCGSSKSYGSGNILICGDAGTGKSTLAFQIAAACASKKNKGIAIYYSLEVDAEQVIENMCKDDKLAREMGIYNDENDEDLEKLLERALEDENNVIEPQILMPCLSPNSLSNKEEDHKKVFMQRFIEIEKMLKAAKLYNASRKNVDPKIKLIAIDSLNAFSNRLLGHEELIRLFNLFKKYGIIGLFVMGDDFKDQINEKEEINNAKFLVDLVINLRKDIMNDYTYNYIEISKSRYTQQVIGRHPYKIQKTKDNDKMLKKAIYVYLSLHCKLLETENLNSKLISNTKAKFSNIFGIEAMEDILPEHFKIRPDEESQIITIAGESGLYKSDLAINAAMNFIIKSNQDDSTKTKKALIIHLSDRDKFQINGFRFNNEIFDACKNDHGTVIFETNPEETKKSHKYTKNSFYYGNTIKLIEISFKSGALMPEEFIDYITEIIKEDDIGLAVFMDLKVIDASYPFLMESPTSGTLFISAFIHIMRNYGVHLLIVSSENKKIASKKPLECASLLSDALISIKKDGNGDISIKGEGLVPLKNHKNYKIVCDKNIDPKGKLRIKSKKTPTCDESNCKKCDCREIDFATFEISEVLI